MTQIIKDINQAAAWIKRDELVAFPTETVYGLGAALFSPTAIEKIYAVKGRPKDNPLIVHLESLRQLDQVAQRIPKDFYRLAEAFLPGPLTVILTKHPSVPDSASAHLPTIGVRIPAHPLARALIAAVGAPLVAPSANVSGRPSSTTAQHVFEDFQGKIAAILDGGRCLLGLESTIVLLEPKPTILRFGAIKQEEIEEVLGTQCVRPVFDKPLAPGMHYRHYAPRARVHLFNTLDKLETHCMDQCLLRRQTHLHIEPCNLYALLRQADLEKCDEILILVNETMRADVALMDRLTRAAQQN